MDKSAHAHHQAVPVKDVTATRVVKGVHAETLMALPRLQRAATPATKMVIARGRGIVSLGSVNEIYA